MDNYFLISALNSQDRALKQRYIDFIYETQNELMIDKAPEKQKTHLKFYDEKADKVWKNLDVGNDVFITYDNDNSEASKYLLSSFANLINKHIILKTRKIKICVFIFCLPLSFYLW